MIFIKVEESNNAVISENYMPFDPKYGMNMTKEQLEEIGYFIEDMPTPEVIVGKAPIKKFNTETKQIYFDYVDIEKTNEELIEETVNVLGQSLAEEKIKNMQKDALISQLGQELANVKLDIMQLKGGV